MALDVVSQSRCFGGIQFTYQHQSSETGTPMRFAAFVPPRADQRPVPVVWYLSGLTCTEENFTVKAGAQRIAAELGLLLIAPDTSPAGMQYPAIQRAHTTSDWARDFTSTQRSRRGPETTEWLVTLSVSFLH
jgi:S-formylglutathione hydrolase FrmB